MPRQRLKIRKRVSSSSSSTSSSMVKNYRFKRAILVGKRGGSSTPVPSWKMGSGSPVNMENMKGVKCNFKGGEEGKESMSARKLGATLWEINGVDEKKEKGRKISSIDNLLDHPPPCGSFCEKEGSMGGSHRRRSSAASHKLQITQYISSAGLDSVANASSVEVPSQSLGENFSSSKTRMKDMSNSLTASKELVKVLFKMLAKDDPHSSRLTLVSALKVELDRARLFVDQLIHVKGHYSNEINAILKQIASEKEAWKTKEKARIQENVMSVTRELEIERKLRKQAERMNKKLGTELADMRQHLSTVMKELDVERRAKEILKQACDELAKGIGEERVEVEELKRETAKVKEDVERERQMMQLADVIREERVQMKLADAKYEYEQKNAALERLRKEVESYFGNEIAKENENGCTHFEANKEFLDFIRKIQNGFGRNEEKERPSEGKVEDGGEDSFSSELHSIELNMDHIDKNYKWSLIREGMKLDDSRRPSVDEMFKGRQSISEKIQWDSICLQRQTSDSIEWDFTGNKIRNINGVLDKRRSFGSDVYANGESKDSEDEMKRYKTNPALDSSKSSFRLREACSAILQDLALRKEQIELHDAPNKQ